MTDATERQQAVDREHMAATLMNRAIDRITENYGNLMMLYHHYPDARVNWSLLCVTLDKLNSYRTGYEREGGKRCLNGKPLYSSDLWP